MLRIITGSTSYRTKQYYCAVLAEAKVTMNICLLGIQTIWRTRSVYREQKSGALFFFCVCSVSSFFFFFFFILLKFFSFTLYV